MKFETTTDLFFVTAAFVPGFVYYAVLTRFVPHHASAHRELLLLRLFTATAFNYGICSPIIYLLATGSLFSARPVGQGLTWLAIIFIALVMLALVVAWASQKDALSWIARKIRLRPINPIPTGWDWIFSRVEPCYLLVTLRDGAQVAGYFGTRSMASSDKDRKDVYLERVFVVPAEGPWEEVDRSNGVYIDGSQFTCIEFRT